MSAIEEKVILLIIKIIIQIYLESEKKTTRTQRKNSLLVARTIFHIRDNNE